jgi:hypothetical protein
MEHHDTYAKLRPPAPTPPDELCTCVGVPLKLMSALDDNPLHCLNCNLEVPPDDLGLSEPIVEAIAGWRSVDDAIHRLWLDSGPYEQWARMQLSDISSAANTRGRRVQSMINDIRRCYFWYFQDTSTEDYNLIEFCPICGERLRLYSQGIFIQRICERASIVTIGE